MMKNPIEPITIPLIAQQLNVPLLRAAWIGSLFTGMFQKNSIFFLIQNKLFVYFLVISTSKYERYF